MILKDDFGGGGDAPHLLKIKHCPLCNFQAREITFVDHLDSPRHVFNYLLKLFNGKREHFSKNRHGITIEARCTKDMYERQKRGIIGAKCFIEEREISFEIEIINGGKESIIMTNGEPFCSSQAFHLSDSEKLTSGSMVSVGLHPGASYIINIKFTNTGIGYYKLPLQLGFLRTQEEGLKTFHIFREIEVVVEGSKVLEEPAVDFKPSPYEGESWYHVNKTVPGTNLKGKLIRLIDSYKIPKDWKPLLNQDLLKFEGMTTEQATLLAQIMDMFEKTGLQEYNYTEYFHRLLYIDEHDAKHKLAKFNMKNVTLNVIFSKLVELEVPGLAEKRPSLLKGDVVYVRVRLGDKQEMVEDTQYQGCVKEVFESCIRICGLNEQFVNKLKRAQDSNQPLNLDVRFSFSRFPLFIMHRSLDKMEKNMYNLLFPDVQSSGKHTTLISKDKLQGLQFFNNKVSSNKEQKQVVHSILQGTSLPAPYIIFGPPGTGKTVTLVESILQVKANFPTSRILVCASCNSTCDYIAEQLLNANARDKNEILRLLSASRDIEAVPKKIHKICSSSEPMPLLEELQRNRILIATLITAGKLSQYFRKGKLEFTHVFIDEAGQSAECETICGISNLLHLGAGGQPTGLLVLAGDPKQLGPICSSEKAEKLGLGVSLLDRLMLKVPIYHKTNGQYNVKFISKLVQNFRSHSAILDLPNELFYNKELVAKCTFAPNDPICEYAFKGQGSKGFPVTFHSVFGQEEREGKSPSIFNTMEIQQVIWYVQELLNSKLSKKVTQEDIGVISPYVRQVYKLRNTFKKLNWNNIEVGTTETYQGREKRIIIVSSVRSQISMLQHDRKYKLGFLVNPRRFCVIMTRAQCKLIVIGNPAVLYGDPNWRKFIEKAKADGAFFGAPLKVRDDNFAQELLVKISNLDLAGKSKKK